MYRLGELGWLQFELLCGLALELESGVGAEGWHGSADRVRRLDADEDVAVPGADRVLSGPVTVLCL